MNPVSRVHDVNIEIDIEDNCNNCCPCIPALTKKKEEEKKLVDEKVKKAANEKINPKST